MGRDKTEVKTVKALNTVRCSVRVPLRCLFLLQPLQPLYTWVDTERRNILLHYKYFVYTKFMAPNKWFYQREVHANSTDYYNVVMLDV